MSIALSQRRERSRSAANEVERLALRTALSYRLWVNPTVNPGLLGQTRMNEWVTEVEERIAAHCKSRADGAEQRTKAKRRG